MFKWILLFTLFSPSIMANKIVQQGFQVLDPHHQKLKHFIRQSDLVVDHVESWGYEVYGPIGTREYLISQNILFAPLETNKNLQADYPNYEQISEQLKSLAQRFPRLSKLFSIGKSRQGKELWVLKISDNPDRDEQEPEFKYVANMHGDEIVGRELMLKLAEDLLLSYSSDSHIRRLIEKTEIFIMPSMNPDGAETQRRGNAAHVDLNRDFPDFTTSDNQNRPGTRQPETKAMMKFQASRNFALSANFHGGTKVINYPWDTSPDEFPLHDLIVQLSKKYAQKVPGMHDSTRFPGGITNGYEWYEVDGGMQDWSFYWHRDLQVTVELSHQKWPDYNLIDEFYKHNRESLIQYIQNVHQGVGLLFPTRQQKKILYTRLKDQRRFGPDTVSAREYYKVLGPGEYKITIQYPDQKEQNYTVNVLPALRPKWSHYIRVNR